MLLVCAHRKVKREKTPAAALSDTESDVPQGWELAGMSFSSVGQVNPPRPELIEIIQKHHGEFT